MMLLVQLAAGLSRRLAVSVASVGVTTSQSPQFWGGGQCL